MPIYGIDYILIPPYFKHVLSTHPYGLSAGGLLIVDCIKSCFEHWDEFAQVKEPHSIRLHGVWQDNHVFTKEEKKKAINRAKRLRPIIESYPAIKWYYSPWLEAAHFKPKVFSKTLEACRNELPDNVKLVASVIPGIDIKNADLIEMHHEGYHTNVSKPTIFSFDGYSAFDAKKEGKLNKMWNKAKNARLAFTWDYKLNGKKDKNDRRGRCERIYWAKPRTIQRLVETLPK